MQATGELKKEHEGIQLMLRVLQAVGFEYGRGKSLPQEDIVKENNVLFPMAEANLEADKDSEL